MPGIKCNNCSFPYRPMGKPCPNCGYNGCFITTAACIHTGEAEESGFLGEVRYFRDTYMQETAERRALVDEYYRIAPAIVDAIDSQADAAREYRRIRAEYLDSAVACIRQNEGEKAERIYIAMVTDLAAKYSIKRMPLRNLRPPRNSSRYFVTRCFANDIGSSRQDVAS